MAGDQAAERLREANRRLAAEVERQRLAIEHLAFLARHDPLTGLLNRQAFEQRVFPHVLGASAPQIEHALLWLDLDNFRVVNATGGPRAGDAFLRQVAESIRQSVRPKDVTARVGGDEFAALLLDCPAERAVAVAEAVRAGIEGLGVEGLSASLGVAPLTAEVATVAELFSRADRACRVAKDQGGRRVMTYEAAGAGARQMTEDVRRRGHLQAVLERGDLRLFRQRIVALRDETAPPRYEILLRLPDPESGAPAPLAPYLPAAERFHLMTRVDRWVVGEVLGWLARPDGEAPPHLWVNLSAQSVGDEAFEAFLDEQLSASPVDPSRLCFEITESVALASLERTAAFIARVRDRGCRFAIDDFGTGFSSYAYLRELPVDYLKIDGSFVRGMLAHETRAAMVRSINDLAHLLELETVAEVVESAEQLERLREIGVDHVQGDAVHRTEALPPA